MKNHEKQEIVEIRKIKIQKHENYEKLTEFTENYHS